MAGNSNFPQSTQHKVENTLNRAGNEIKDKAQDLTDKARQTASNVADKARDTASNVKDHADDALTTVGQKMTHLAGTIRENAPREGMLGNAASTVAQNLHTGGRYLQENGVDDMGQDVTKMVRQYPVQSLLMSFGIGCLLGMTFRR